MAVNYRLSICLIGLFSLKLAKPFTVNANELNLDSFATTSYSVAIEPLADFNYKTKSDILKLREGIVEKNSTLHKGNYKPSEKIFGGIQDGKPWWGIEGYYSYAGTNNSILGNAEESRFILNPYVLIGIREPQAWINKNMPTPSEADNYYPKALSVTYGPGAVVTATYTLKDHFSYLIRNNYNDLEKKHISIITYNAADFGYQYLRIDEKKSKNLADLQGTNKPTQLHEFIHLGSSCGHEMGCNNVSPYIREFEFEVSDFPAEAVIYLWKNDTTKATPDLTYIMKFQ